MGGYYGINFEKVNVKFNKELIENLLNILFKMGCTYNKYYLGGYDYDVNEKDFIGERVMEDKIDGDPKGERLKQAVEKVSKYGGVIDLELVLDDKPADFLLHIRPSYEDKDTTFIALSINRVYFRDCQMEFDNPKFQKFRQLGEAIKKALNIKQEVKIEYEG